MAFTTRTLLLILVRLVPLALVLTLSIFWSNEKNLRLTYERKADENMSLLLDAEGRIQDLTQTNDTLRNDVIELREEVQRIRAEKRHLIDELSERDEHIRRLLQQMMEAVQGNGDRVDLGEISEQALNNDWTSVHRELNQIEVRSPMMMPQGKGLRQTSIEVMPNPAPAASQITSSATTTNYVSGNSRAAIEVEHEALAEAFNESRIGEVDGEIVVVNQAHNFVVINRGLEHGVFEGLDLWLERNGESIGRVRVETVYRKICAATVLDGHVAELKPGYKVHAKLKPSE